MPLLLSVYHIAQALLAAYTGILSYNSIRRVQTYEDMSKKAAKYSNTADYHLQTTRTTMAAGAVSVLSSTLTSLYLFTTSTKTTSPTTLTPMIICIVLATGISLAHSHISNYWRGKMKVPVPGSKDYNDAITSSNRMRTFLDGLSLSWVLAAMGYFVLWNSS